MRASVPSSAFHRSPRWYGRAIVLLVLALGCAACAPATSSGIGPTATISAHAPRQLPASEWEHIALPASTSDVQGVAVSPTDPATLFACTTQRNAFWRTTDAGAHWTRYALAFGATDQCFFSFAPDDPQRVTLQVQRPTQDSQPCARDRFYLSDDGGVTWRNLPPHTSIAPATVSYGGCELQVTRRHLYLAYSYEPSAQTPQVSLLERSDDNGASWVRADRGLGDNVLFSMPAIGPGDMLAMTVLHVAEHPWPTEPGLWASTNAGDSWQQTSTLPEGVGTFLLSLPPRGNTWPTPEHPFYVLEHEQIPSNLYRARVLMSGDGRNWTLLPPLPVPGVTELRAGILQVLGVLPDGRLAVWGTDPAAGLPTEEIATQKPVSAFWLWLWDPMTQTWQVMPSPLDVTAREGCGLCWQAQSAMGRDGAMYVYVSRFWEDPTGATPPGWFRIRLASV